MVFIIMFDIKGSHTGLLHCHFSPMRQAEELLPLLIFLSKEKEVEVRGLPSIASQLSGRAKA